MTVIAAATHVDLLNTLLNVAREVGPTGAADVALMALLVYLGLAWLRRSRATKVLQGILLLGLIYLAARLFNLSLTSAVLEAVFAVALVAVIVIFRDELRRLFEQVARWRPRGRRGQRMAADRTTKLVEVLTRTLTDLAQERTGALVVLRGTEALETQLEGGERLGGEVSEALLKSLFDPHSIGHDGALVIEQGLVSRFGCHLPLSRAFDQLGNHGTRHAAALGLAERTDALCLVVSEERGTISVAQDGTLRAISGAEQLTGRLQSFLGQAAAPRRRSIGKVLTVNLPTKLAALGISALLWLVLVHGAKQTVRQIVVPVRPAGLPAGLEVARLTPDEATLTVAGPRRSFYFFGRDTVALSVELSGLRAGQRRRRLHADNVTFPRDLTLREIRPSQVTVTLRATTDKPSH